VRHANLGNAGFPVAASGIKAERIMMNYFFSPPRAAILIAAVSAAVLAGAWFFQLAVGLPPCPLCLEQRIPYYIAVPLALAVAALAKNVSVTRAGFVLLAIVLAAGCGLAIYHAGIEWKWWAGPQDCSGSLDALSRGGSILDQLKETRVVRCDEAAWRFLGISLAGYNALIAAALTAFALWTAAAAKAK
jgi:disulfide bond formation protein DsbB